MTTKILTVYHKPASLIKNDVYTPIYVGAENGAYADYFANEYKDCEGENISDKNPVYNEMTAIYWAWKNYDKLGNPDYIGINHYRRLFIFGNAKKSYYETKTADARILDKINFSQDALQNALNSGDFIAPIPGRRASVKRNYIAAHGKDGIEAAQKIISEKHPDFLDATNSYFNGKKSYFYNMFIFDRDTFFKYCDWIFNILFELERTAEHPIDRMYISERLTGVFMHKLELDGKKPTLLPTLFITGEKPNFKSSLAQAKSNLASKNGSFLYRLKPIILYFTPSFILRMRRRRRGK